MLGQNHVHKKLKHKKHAVDRLVYIAVIGGPIMTLPQVYDIWILHRTGVSVVSWTAYTIGGLLWLWYGVVHRDLPIILVQVIWTVLDIAIITGILML